MSYPKTVREIALWAARRQDELKLSIIGIAIALLAVAGLSPVMKVFLAATTLLILSGVGLFIALLAWNRSLESRYCVIEEPEYRGDAPHVQVPAGNI